MKKAAIKKRMDIYQTIISFPTDKQIKAQLEALASKEDRPLSYVVNQIIKKHLGEK